MLITLAKEGYLGQFLGKCIQSAGVYLSSLGTSDHNDDEAGNAGEDDDEDDEAGDAGDGDCPKQETLVVWKGLQSKN